MTRIIGPKATVAALFEAADRGDMRAIESLIAPDYVDHSRTTPGTDTDREHALNAFTAVAAAFPDARHRLLALIGEGDLVVARVQASGRHVAPYKGVPATGRIVEMTTTTVYRVTDGVVRERWCDGLTPITDHLPDGPRTGRTDVRLLAGDTPWLEAVDGARYREVSLSGLSFTEFEVEEGSDFPRHAHESEQITFVLEGVLAFEVAGRRHDVGPGEAIAIPSNLPHRVTCVAGPSRAVDAWSPPPTHLS